MPRVAYIQTNFTAGELSPRLRARVNWEKYPNGVETMENFLIQTHGPAAKRPGLRYVAGVKTHSKKVRLIPFEFSVSQSYVLEFGEQYVRFYTNQGQVLDGAVPYEVATDYLEADLPDIKFVQSADVLFLVHPDYPPKMLARYGHTSWKLTSLEFKNGPFLPLNTTETTIEPSATSGDITLTAVPADGPELLTNGNFEAPLSPEMVNNNAFSFNPDDDWTWGANWSHDQTNLNALHGAGDTAALSQDVSALAGYSYKVVFTVSGRTAGSVTVSLGGATGAARSTNATFTEYLTASSTAALAFTPTVDFDGAIDSVSVKKLTVTTAWTFGVNWAHNTVGEKATHTAGATNSLDQAILTTTGEIYQVVFTVSGRSAGSVTPYIGTQVGKAVSTNTTSTQLITANGPQTLSFVPTSTFDGNVDSVSCKLYGKTATVFDSQHVGSYWRLRHETGATIVAATQANPCLLSSAAHGLKTGDKVILLNMQPGVWSTLSGLSFSVTVADTNNFWIPYDTSGFTGYLASSGSWVKANGGYCRITSIVSGQTARAEVIDSFSSTGATTEWAEGAWSDYRGYPGAIAFFEERLFFAGTATQPQTLWGSTVGDYYDFYLGAEDDDGVEWTLSSEKLNIIQWLCVAKVMLIGTAGGIWRLMSSSLNEPVTPTNFNFKREISTGSDGRQAVQSGIVVLHVQRQSKKVRELAYQFEIDGFVSQDMTLLSEHITGDGVAEIALQSVPDIILWCVLTDGTLAAMTYERAQSVVGWHRHETDGLVESITVIPGANSDEVWLAVKRTINGSTKRYVEFMEPADAAADLSDRFYVDCGATYDGVAANQISGLDHLENKTVNVLADGTVHPDCVVASGKITLNAKYSTVQVGLPYTAVLKTLPIEAGAAEGTAQGKIKRIHGLTLMLADAAGLYAGTEESDATLVETGSGLFTGDVYQAFIGGYDNRGQIHLQQDDPLPVTVQGIVPRVTTYDA